MIFRHTPKITPKDDAKAPARQSMVRLHPGFGGQETPMKKTVPTFGLISGAISSLMMAGTAVRGQDRL
jgi:hypothetical protein